MPRGSEDYHLKASLCSRYGASVKDLITKMPSSFVLFSAEITALFVFVCVAGAIIRVIIRLLHAKLTINMLAVNIYCRRWLPLIYLPVGDTAQWKCSNVTLQPFNNIRPLYALCIMCRTDIHTHTHTPGLTCEGGRFHSAVRVYM